MDNCIGLLVPVLDTKYLGVVLAAVSWSDFRKFHREPRTFEDFARSSAFTLRNWKLWMFYLEDFMIAHTVVLHFVEPQNVYIFAGWLCPYSCSRLGLLPMPRRLVSDSPDFWEGAFNYLSVCSQTGTNLHHTRLSWFTGRARWEHQPSCQRTGEK